LCILGPLYQRGVEQYENAFLILKKNSSVTRVNRLRAGQLENWDLISAETKKFSFLHCILNGFGAHPPSYQTSTRGSFPGGKDARA
jgi:hypothetical protein